MTALLTVLVGFVVVVVVRARREAAGIAQEPIELQIEEDDNSSRGSQMTELGEMKNGPWTLGGLPILS